MIHIRCVIDVLWGTDILFTFITVSQSTELYLDDYNQRPTWACITQIVTNNHVCIIFINGVCNVCSWGFSFIYICGLMLKYMLQRHPFCNFWEDFFLINFPILSYYKLCPQEATILNFASVSKLKFGIQPFI